MSRERLVREQRLFGEFLLDPEVEAAVRRDPVRIAEERDVSTDLTSALATLDEARVRAFRASCRHKDELRRGKRPRRLG